MPLTAAQKDTIVRTVLGEAANQGTAGMQAVAAVIKNRADSGQFPSDPAAVATQPYQFSANNALSNGGNTVGRNASANSKVYQEAADAVDAIFNGDAADPTGGALYYYAPAGMPNGQAPSWASSMYPTAQIGGHLFYSPSPTPPGTVPMVGSAYADTSSSSPASNIINTTFGASNPVPLAPFAAAQFGGNAGDQLAMAPYLGSMANQMPLAFNSGSSYGMVPQFANASGSPDDRDSSSGGATLPAASSGTMGGGLGALPPATSSPPSSSANTQSWQDYITPSYANTTGGIAGLTGLPSGFTPSGATAAMNQAVQALTGQSSTNSNSSSYGGPYNEMDAATGGSSMAMNDPGYGNQNANYGDAGLASLSLPSSVNVPKYITVNQQIQVPSGQPLETTPDATWVADANDPNGGEYVMNSAQASPAAKYKTVNKPVQVLNPAWTAQSGLAALPKAQISVPATMTKVQQLQATGLSPSAAYAAAAAPALAAALNPTNLPYYGNSGPASGYFGPNSTGASNNGFGGGAPGGLSA